MTDPIHLQRIAQRALDFVQDGNTIGLGTGRAASAFIRALGPRVADGLRVRGVPTSQASSELATRLQVPLTTLDESPVLDLDVDGADEVDPQGNLIKGHGGALVREKVVATAARRLIIVVGSEKIVDQLGSRSKLPVEVIPFAVHPCTRSIRELGLMPQLRLNGNRPTITDNGNYILDCESAPIERPADLEAALRAIPGVVGTGLFLSMNPIVLVGYADRVEIRQTA